MSIRRLALTTLATLIAGALTGGTAAYGAPTPGVRAESASNVAATSATLEAQIDPEGVPAFYYFQYGTSTAYGADVPALSETAPHGVALGAGAEFQEVGVHVQGLQAGVTYHYRAVVIAETGAGEFAALTGPDHTFSTQSTGAAVALPDGRAWEMVTPPNKQGAGLTSVGNEQGADIQAAADGHAFTYGATAPFAENPAGSRSWEITQVFSARTAPGAWATNDITTAHEEGASGFAAGHSAEYKLFSQDLSLGMVEPAGDTPLPPLPADAEKTVYLRKASGEYEALVTAANVTSHAKFSEGPEHPEDVIVDLISASPDLKHVIVEGRVGLTSTPGDEGGLYEWSGGQLQLVSILPDGMPASYSQGLYLGDNSGVVRDALSRDGSRTVWAEGSSKELFLRDLSRRETVKVDAAQGGLESEARSTYQTASADDSRIFFTSGARLTPDSTAPGAAQEPDLYEYEVTSSASEPLAGRLTDLTVDTNPGESADVQNVIGASEDGSSIYFVARGVLGDGAARGAEKGGWNLYLEHLDAAAGKWESPVFIAALSSEDYPTWGGNSPEDLSRMTARVSPNGRYLAFMSERSLTGYDNRDAASGVPDEEVFIYDAESARLACASCNPTGARPEGTYENGDYEEKLVDYPTIWIGRWQAANIPGWDSEDLSRALYQSRYLSDDGRLFFDSSDALVPGDVNGKEDVYEYEPDGFGSCQGADHGQNAGDVFDEAADGCVALISSGTSGEESAFMDASETAGDVFFMTLTRLTAQDYDTSIDVYDAHECTQAAPCAPTTPLVPPPCSTGDACKTSPTPQPAIFGAPSSATFSGAGNITSSSGAVVTPRSNSKSQKLKQALTVCKRVPKRRRSTCRRRAEKRYGAAGAGRNARTSSRSARQ